MSERIVLSDPIFKLIIRFSNGETIGYVVRDPVDARDISPDSRYAVITSVSCENPGECAETAIVNLRDVSFIRTERTTLDQLAAERRMAGMRAYATPGGEDRHPRNLAEIRFI